MTIPKEKTELHTISVGDTTYETMLTAKFLKRKPWVAPDPRKVKCVIPGVVLRIHVKPNQRVSNGEPLLTLEAMKMQNELRSPLDGTVKAVHVEAGQQVAKGQLLLELA